MNDHNTSEGLVIHEVCGTSLWAGGGEEVWVVYTCSVGYTIDCVPYPFP